MPVMKFALTLPYHRVVDQSEISFPTPSRRGASRANAGAGHQITCATASLFTGPPAATVPALRI